MRNALNFKKLTVSKHKLKVVRLCGLFAGLAKLEESHDRAEVPRGKYTEPYRKFFVSVFAQSVAAYVGLSKQLQVQWERDCPGIPFEPPTSPPTPSYTYSGPIGKYACRGGFLQEGAESDPLRGDYFDIFVGIT